MEHPCQQVEQQVILDLFRILDDSFGTIQVPISRDFKVNIYRSVIPQEIDIQENINAKLSIKELGDSGIEDFEF